MAKPEKNFMTRKQYLELPRRDWDKKKQYTAVIVVPTYKIHDSGFRLMALVGCGDDHKPYEIAAFCDDICWDTPDGFKNVAGLFLGRDMEHTVTQTDIEQY